MPSSDERRLLRDAMSRLLDGTPVRSDGALTIVGLAEEAGVKRHLLTHKHTDLREEFYARVRSQGRVPQSEITLRQRIGDLEDLVRRLTSERDELSRQVDTLWRMNNVLSVERAHFEEALEAMTTGQVRSIFRRRGSRLGKGEDTTLRP